MEEKEDETDMISKIAAMKSENLTQKFTTKRKKEIISIWFRDFIIGPLMMTRSLSIHDVGDYDCIEGRIIKQILHLMR